MSQQRDQDHGDRDGNDPAPRFEQERVHHRGI
jgi:hypothetical protein